MGVNLLLILLLEAENNLHRNGAVTSLDLSVLLQEYWNGLQIVC